MLCAILYLENSDKARFSDLKNHVENDYMLNKAEYPRTVTSVQSLPLNYQPNYNSNGNSQSNRVINQLIFVQRGKTGYDEGDGKEKDQIPRRNLDHITCNDCGEKFIMLGTMTSQLKPSSNRMQRYSGRWIRRNFPTSPLVEETRNHWWFRFEP